MSVRWVRVGLGVLATAAVVAAPLPDQGASASCAAPYIQVGEDWERPTLRPGAEVEVTGRAFVNGCDDGGSQTAWGCSTDEGEVETPMTDVRLRIQQGSRTWELGEADALSADEGEVGHVAWTITLPTGLEPGRARLLADNAEPLRLRVVDRPGG